MIEACHYGNLLFLMRPETESMLRYWRNCLAYSSRPKIRDYFLDSSPKVSRDALCSGKIDLRIVQKIYQLWHRNRAESDTEISNLPVIVSPYVAALRFSHGQRDNRPPSRFAPLCIPASLRKEDGILKPVLELTAWIPRELLEPIYGINPVLGTLESMDHFLTRNPWSAICDSWEKAYSYSSQLLEHVTGQSVHNFQIDDCLLEENGVIVPVGTFDTPSKHLAELYEHILSQGREENLPLLARYADQENVPLIPSLEETKKQNLQKMHLAQMGNRHPLAPDQRAALLHFSNLDDGQILAINGPPGTGKTTLLQNVIATLWTQSALAPDSEPPVIVVTSTNNQAVTNVIESLATPAKDGSILDERWLPNLQSYGLYCASSMKLEASMAKYQCTNTDGDPFPHSIETVDYLNGAEAYFMDKFCEWNSRPSKDIAEAKEILHGKLLEKTTEIRNALDSQALWLQWNSFMLQNYPPKGDVAATLEKISNESNQLEDGLKKWFALEQATEAHYSQSPFWMHLFSWLKLVRDRLDSRMRVFLLAQQIRFSGPLYNLQGFRKFLQEKVAESEAEKTKLEQHRNSALDHKHAFDEAGQKWQTWCRNHSVDPQADENDLSEILDKGLRHETFLLAQHFWEVRWLLERREDVLNHYEEKQSVTKQMRKWRRYAKLTPCLVSTLHMLPKFFHAWRGERQPLYNFIDLLILDEAGQITPEIGAPAFSLAKKALVVGDLQQIEPVWEVSKSVDEGNLEKSIRADPQKLEWFLTESGLSATSGCVMRIAQRASQYGEMEANRGLFLSSHYRCFDEIISYCNKLAYHGKLEPKRGKAPGGILPTWGYAHVPGTSEKCGQSRGNRMEARAIAAWVKQQGSMLCQHYDGAPLKEILGIVTPFGLQTRLIEAELEKVGMNEITVGTIHRLQGAQRNIIIFSPVYDRPGDVYFFDKGKNMLNVAVSRAKDHFLVFGNTEIFDPSRPLPSGLLAHYLFASETNELAGFDFPIRDELLNGDGVRHLLTLEAHREILQHCFERARSRVIIISPYLSSHAVRRDALDQLIKTHSQRIEIKVFSDWWFNHKDGEFSTSAQEALKMLQASGAEVVFAKGIHNKTLCVDDDVLIEGSFNWFSAMREKNHPWQRLETSICYESPNVREIIKSILNAIQERGFVETE